MVARTSIWQNRNFTRVWLGQFVSAIGDGMHTVAILWWVKVSTGSDALVALIALCSAVAGVLLSPIGGVYADRVERRRLMISMDVARAVLLGVAVVALATGELKPWMVCILAAGLSSLSAFFGPALGASTPQLVAAEQLQQANSMNQSAGAMAGLIGPALGGVLVAVLGTPSVLAFDALTFLFSAACIFGARIPMPVRKPGTERQHVLADLREGLLVFRADRLLWGTVLMTAGLNFLAGPLQVLMPGIAHDVLHTSSTGFGMMEAAMSAGFIVGAVLTGVIKAPRVGPFIIWPIVASGLAIAGAGFSRSLPLTVAMLALAGINLAVCNIFLMVIFQTRVEPSVQGRAFGALGSLSGGLRPIALAVTAPLIVLAGGAANLAVACGLALSAGGFGGFVVPGLPNLARPRTGGTPVAAD
ncbi:MAG TPA: MFS transporter [Deinococcales bacterium]|nr:MFS transporter [Deinococcales bacterium]